MKTSRQIYEEILSDGTFKAMLHDNIRRTEAMKRADRNYASRRRQDLIKSVENSLFLSSWAASGYGKFWDEGIYDWLDSLWLTSTDEKMRAFEERRLRADMWSFLLAYIEMTEYLYEQQPEPELADILTVGIVTKAKEKGRDLVADIQEYLSTHHTKTEITAMAAYLYDKNRKCIRNRPNTFSKFLPKFAEVVGVECPDPRTFRPSSPQVKSKIKEIENILFYL